ncbi:hypothetical protein YSKK_19200 [Halopseudomonas aestusnigri]|nr:hypothetical protein YSKK_19200 [Halopseudomonas aestusnigri]
MFNRKLKYLYKNQSRDLAEQKAQISALKTHMACLECTPDGQIIDANTAMLTLLGYSRERLIGQSHDHLCDAKERSDGARHAFWTALAQGRSCAGTYRRLGAGGQPLWLEATYCPVPDASGTISKVVMLASDVTAEHAARLEQKALLTALDKSLAVIEFSPNGEIITANRNFLSAVGYSLQQIIGKHHRMFCNEAFIRQHPEFWAELGRGEFK